MPLPHSSLTRYHHKRNFRRRIAAAAYDDDVGAGQTQQPFVDVEQSNLLNRCRLSDTVAVVPHLTCGYLVVDGPLLHVSPLANFNHIALAPKCAFPGAM